ncbi:3-deoxy-D-manno-octulosonic acid transferase [Spirosoma luteolum]
MFAHLYNAGIGAYPWVVRLASTVNRKARLWYAGQQGVVDRLLAVPILQPGQHPDRPLAWFHAASLGEFEQGRPVIEAFRQHYPHYRILLTFFSPSGYEVRKDYDGVDYVDYLPVDTPANARRLVKGLQPAIAFFIKYEFWANYLRELKAAGAVVISFSAIFRPDQLFFKPYGGFYRQMLHQFDQLLVQNQESVDLLASIDVRQVRLGGDTRFDRVAQTAATIRTIPVAASFRRQADGTSAPVLVVGSAWQSDMDVLLPFLNQFDRPLKVIIAPHEIHSDELTRWQQQLRRPSIRYSEAGTGSPDRLAEAAVLFIDNIGMLSSLYQYGTFAYIGGAFREGLHNILEAATFGMPIFFGPVYDKYQEAVELVAEGGAFPISSTADLLAAFGRQYADHASADQITRSYVLRNVGATAAVMDVVTQLLGIPPTPADAP